MKKYGFPILLFGSTLGLGASLYKLLEPSVNKEGLGLLLKLFLGVLFVIYTLRFVRDKKVLFRFGRFSKEQLGLILFLAALFVLNNYFLAAYGTEVDFMNNNNFKLVILSFIVNSFYEEFAYRGFIQNYVNQNTQVIKSPISIGNLLASGLMTITHFGFFWVMDTVFATTGVALVLIFSLTAGFIRDKGASIWLLIIIHTIMNGIHVVMNLEHYIR
jgi:membrane protease YdiL (CAAX protease family)